MRNKCKPDIIIVSHFCRLQDIFRIYPKKLVLAELRRATPPLQSSRCLGLMFGVGFGGEKGPERIVVYLITLRSFICPQAPPPPDVHPTVHTAQRAQSWERAKRVHECTQFLNAKIGVMKRFLNFAMA